MAGKKKELKRKKKQAENEEKDKKLWEWLQVLNKEISEIIHKNRISQKRGRQF